MKVRLRQDWNEDQFEQYVKRHRWLSLNADWRESHRNVIWEVTSSETRMNSTSILVHYEPPYTPTWWIPEDMLEEAEDLDLED